jgi:hypothetical protein
VAASTGFRTVTQNAGDVTNRGVEVSLGVTPVRNDRMSLDAGVNLTRNWSKVARLAPELDYIYLAGSGTSSIRIHEDYGYGVIWGTRYQRNAQGQLLIGSDGFPLVDPTTGMLGEIAPTWLANFSAVAPRVRRLALLDARRGGDILNADLRSTIPAGTAKITEQRNDNYVFDGVSAANGQKNTTSIVRNQAFWTRYAAVDENLVGTATSCACAKASFTVALPQRLSRVVEMQRPHALPHGS